MKETVSIQVGQCGNQIGNYFWSLLLQEQQENANASNTDLGMPEAFFRYDTKSNKYRARALLIDMECGVLNETMKSEVGQLFDESQFVMDVYGAGNNFACGHYLYGPKYQESYEEGVRQNVEQCDSIQNFLVMHSLAGGTGSGVGTFVVKLLSDLYPKTARFSTCVIPNDGDSDVITGPYNSILASQQLIEHADCIFPMDNEALAAFNHLERNQLALASSRSNNSSNRSADIAGFTHSTNEKPKKSHGFDEINSVAARMLCHLTSSHRFPGSLNVDLNDICTNLVPYNRLQWLITAMSPVRASSISAGRPLVTEQRSTGSILSSVNHISDDGSGSNVGSSLKEGSSATGDKRVRSNSISAKRSGQASASRTVVARKPAVKSTRATIPSLSMDGYVKILSRAFSDVVYNSQLAQLPNCSGLLTTFSLNSLSATNSKYEPPVSVTLASAYLCRGRQVPMSELLQCVLQSQKKVTYPEWNQNATKIGLCSVPAPREHLSVLGVYNSTSIAALLERERSRFTTLFKRRANAHHYTEYITIDDIAYGDSVVLETIQQYRYLSQAPGMQRGLAAYQSSFKNRSRPPANMRDRRSVLEWDPVVFPAF